jgi:anthranilate phosphoribosyltransferase
MREKFVAVDAHDDKAADIVGTGGDGAHTFNISTTAALVTAGCGITVAKHGNRSVSSKCGSADVLNALGINIAIDAETMSACLKEIGVAFLFAPSLHPAMKYGIGPRREIGIRTIFNILGPLCNPAGTNYGLMGVYSSELVGLMASAARDLDARHLFVVHAHDGLDEITITASTEVTEVKNGELSSYEIDPRELGIELCAPAAIVGGEPGENAEITRSILAGEAGPRRDIVCLNAAAAIVSVGKASSLAEGMEIARDSIDSGNATAKLEALIEFTNP